MHKCINCYAILDFIQRNTILFNLNYSPPAMEWDNYDLPDIQVIESTIVESNENENKAS